jgi:hypothetical protein
MKKIIWVVVLLAVSLGVSTRAFAFTAREKKEVLNLLLDLQEQKQNKDDPQLQAVIDSVVSTMSGSHTAPIINREVYQAALNHQLSMPAGSRLTEIMVDALTNRISNFPKMPPVRGKAPGALGPAGEVLGQFGSPGIEQKEAQVIGYFRRQGLQPSQFTRQGYLRNRYRSNGDVYLHYWNQGDGDCGLHGLRIKRADFVARVSQSFQGDLELRNALRSDVYAYCADRLRRTDCLSVLESSRDLANRELFTNYISRRLSSQDEYLSFARSGSQSVGTLVAAAKVFNKNMRVWGAKPNGELELKLEFKGGGASPMIDLLHSGQHFDTLVLESDLAGRSYRLDNEQIFAAQVVAQMMGGDASSGVSSSLKSRGSKRSGAAQRGRSGSVLAY